MIQTVVYDSSAAGNFTLKEAEEPRPSRSKAVVRVEAFSLNQGEVRDAAKHGDGFRPGWDFAGTVIEAAADGSGPAAGSRVFGLLLSGAWAEKIAAPTSQLAEIPDGLSFKQAAALPVAGLSALYTLRKGGLLLGRRVLITGSTGGVGLLAHRLAALSGAYVTGTARSEEKAALVREAGADEVIVGEMPPAGAAAFAPYDLIIDSVGGETLTALVPMLIPGGTLVSMGYSSSPSSALDIRELSSVGGRTLYGFFLAEELNRSAASPGLSLLARLAAEGKLTPHIGAEASWEEIGRIARRLLNREFSGKAVLTVRKAE
ncbi:zinc-binding dehydrogenase [Saccharibacillus sp. CPCC 101409]|uniref:zinc-binding dehydrogenase n=1 Tax=Saccharibacillus sp. CPCC 101409 TaxID=3058041 RepID=UPI0026714FC5|nr:zinc-binding dehydrogenase [Saccharibacillus sp. CPCC 101409]MDO3411877.1 zinc-binding dehydrogenase [Saccharibacillus sp. CPCC 101409]